MKLKTSKIIVVLTIICFSITPIACSSPGSGEKLSLGQQVKSVFQGAFEAIKDFMDVTSDNNPPPKYIVEMHDGRILRANEYWNEGQEVVLKAYESEVHVKKSAIKEIRSR